MMGLREHIECNDRLDLVAIFCKSLQIPRQNRRLARDVRDLLRTKTYKVHYRVFLGSRTRRVEQNEVEFGFNNVRKITANAFASKFDIVKIAVRCIALTKINRFLVFFNTDNVLETPCKG